jgi:drug/metabolite transporter (DMT)-like permease
LCPSQCGCRAPARSVTIEPVNLKIILQLLALSSLWGATFPMLKVASPLLGPSTMAMFRVLIGATTLALLMRATGQRWPWKHWRELTLLSMLTVAAPFFLFSWAALKLPSGYIALFNSTAVVFGMLVSVWLKEDVLTVRKLLGCTCGFAGVALIVRLGPVQPTHDVLMGAAAAILAAMSFGFALPFMKRAMQRLEPLAIAGPVHAIGLIFLLPTGLGGLPKATFTPAVLVIILVLGALNSGLAFWLHLRILRTVTPVAAMSPVFLIPVFGVTWGYLFLDEQFNPGIYAGGALVLLAAALVTGFNPFRRRKNRPG